MNKRIDQLLVKAGAVFGGEGVVYDTFDPKKFAELIVRECAEVARLNTRIDSKLYLMIKQHFGVEE